ALRDFPRPHAAGDRGPTAELGGGDAERLGSRRDENSALWSGDTGAGGGRGMMRTIAGVLAAIAVGACATAQIGGRASLVEERPITELRAAMEAGETTSESLVEAYQARIKAIDKAGPKLRSVISVNPEAV